jgi:hypothetical protein
MEMWIPGARLRTELVPVATDKQQTFSMNTAGINKIIILPVVLYGCETWSLTLRKEHRLRGFENRVLRRIFGPKRD